MVRRRWHGWLVTRCITVRRSVAATRSELWAACATARGMAGWQADAVIGDAAAGREVTLSWPSLNLSVDVHVVEVVSEERLVLVLGQSRLTIVVETGGIQLIHEGLASEDEEQGMKSAWQGALGVLAHGLEAHRGRPRRVRWLLQPIETSAPFAHVYFTEPRALAQWLTRSGGVGSEGSPVELDLWWGARISGKVIANTPDRDLVLSWSNDEDSCLALRTLPAPGLPNRRLVALCWSRWSESDFPSEHVRGMEGALERLARVLGRRGKA